MNTEINIDKNGDINKEIIKQFELLIKQIKIEIDFSSKKDKLKHMFRLKSIEHVLKEIKKFTNKISSSDQLKNIKGIGINSLKRIDEILQTGKLKEIKLQSDKIYYLNTVDKLEKIFGIGRIKAFELIKKYNIKSIDDLKKKYSNGEIKLSQNIIKGLKYINKITDNIPRSEIYKINFIIKNLILQINPKLIGIICGSFRREKQTSNDIDLLLVHTDYIKMNDLKKHNYLHDLILLMKQKKIIIDSLTSENVKTKYMGLIKNNIRIDIRYIPYQSYYSALLYFTGSGDFNKRMRQVALDMNYTLNEYGLFNEHNKLIKINSEKDIFDKLNLEYIQPHMRY